MGADHFLAQARQCSSLGSPFTARLLRCVAPLLDQPGPIQDRIRTWPGDAGPAADSVPLRLAGGFHTLVLSGQAPDLAALYPPNPTPSDASLAKALTAAMKAFAAPLNRWLDSAPQTNETARTGPLAAAGALLSQKAGMPLRLLELGTSAGLNLYWDKFTLAAGRQRDAGTSPLTLTPDWQGAPPPGTEIRIASRAGVDLNPFTLSDPMERLRMLSYIWPDQPDRMERMRAAQAVALADPARIDQGDAADWIDGELQVLPEGQMTCVFHSIAWQYFPQQTQTRAEAAIRTAGANATTTAPLAWLSMEADGNEPGAALSLRTWPDGREETLGRSDFHGRWVQWQPEADR